MSNAWLNHVRQFRKNNRHLSYKQLLSQAKNTYGGGDDPKPPMSGLQSAMQSLKAMTSGGGVTGFESRSSLTRSASTVGGRSRKSRRSSRKTRRSRR